MEFHDIIGHDFERLEYKIYFSMIWCALDLKFCNIPGLLVCTFLKFYSS